MSELLIDFAMTNALISQAAREDCMSFAREHVKVKDILVILASTAIFARAVYAQSHWLWWFAGLPLAGFLVLVVGWLIAYLWLPRSAVSRLMHLPHRQVRVELSDKFLSFQSATERLEVAWGELQDLKRRPNFWLFCLRSGARIPVPAVLLTRAAVSLLEAKQVKAPI